MCSKIDYLCDMGAEGAVTLDGFDDAIVGVSEGGKVVYDYDKMVQCLVDRDGMTDEEAMEFIDYNTIRSIPYAGALAPIVMYPIREEDLE